MPRYAGVLRFPQDDDADNDHNDDENIRTFGRVANRAEERAMVATLWRYYTAAAQGNGGEACAMFTPAFRKVVPLEYGRYGVGYMRGNTCPGVMSRVFKHLHGQLVSEDTKMKVINARVEGDKGYVVVRPHAPCVRETCVLSTHELLIGKLLMQRERGSWKVEALFLKA